MQRKKKPKKLGVVVMTPRSVEEVEALVRKKLLWKLGAAGLGACRRIVNEALGDLPGRFPHSTQVREYMMEEGRLRRLLNALGE